MRSKVRWPRMSSASSFPWFSAVALLLSVVGLFVPPIALVGILLGVLAVKRARSPLGKRIAQASVLISCAGLLAFAALLALKKGQTSSATSSVECQVGLEALLLAQDAHRKIRGRYAGSQSELGIPVARQYFLEAQGEHAAALQELKVGQAGQCPDCTVTMACLERPPQTWWTITTGGKPVAHASP